VWIKRFKQRRTLVLTRKTHCITKNKAAGCFFLNKLACVLSVINITKISELWQKKSVNIFTCVGDCNI